MATHSSILVWKIPCTEDPGRLQFMDIKGSDRTEQLTHTQIDKQMTNRWQIIHRQVITGSLLHIVSESCGWTPSNVFSKYAVGNSYNKVFRYIVEMKIGNTSI